MTKNNNNTVEGGNNE